jgi:hypothetical protein
MARNKRPKPGQELSRWTISEVTRYKVWDCSSCKIRGINANKCMQCPQCGNGKDASDHEERSATEVDENYQFEGADITCQFCKTENKKRFSCRQCGAALDEKFAKQVANFTVGPTGPPMPTRTVQLDDQGFLPDATDTPWTAGMSTDSVEPVVLEEPVLAKPDTPPLPPPADEPKPRRQSARNVTAGGTGHDEHGRKVLIVALAIAALVVLLGLYVYNKMNSYTQTTATVESVSWTYSLPREDYASRSRSHETESYFWRPPGEAFDVRSIPTIIRYEPVYEQVWVPNTCTRTETTTYDNPNGTWTSRTDLVTYDCSRYETKQVRTDPIEGTRWTWKVMAWEATTPLTAGGSSYTVTYPTFVPTETLRQAGPPVTTFTITFSYTDDDGEVQSADRDYPRATWERTSIGARYDSLVDGFDRLRAVSGLDPEYQQLLE